jgi:hypothetical protein
MIGHQAILLSLITSLAVTAFATPHKYTLPCPAFTSSTVKHPTRTITRTRIRRSNPRTRTFPRDYRHTQCSKLQASNDFWNGITELWDEFIEVSTYGPSERKMLKANRERQRQRQRELQQDDYDSSSNSQDTSTNSASAFSDDNGDDAWLEAFQSAKNSKVEDTDTTPSEADLDFDGYALRDVLIAKWGVPLDIDFQSGASSLYCTVLPMVGYGSPLKSRHDSELDYLMHLQGVVEVLHKYDNLDGFLVFVQETNRAPKPGTDSVPFRLDLSEEEKEKIMVLKNGL